MKPEIGINDNHRESVVRILNVLKDLVTCAERHGDAGTNDFLTGLMERHEKMSWMLRSFLGTAGASSFADSQKTPFATGAGRSGAKGR